jgi:hypothetical protein
MKQIFAIPLDEAVIQQARLLATLRQAQGTAYHSMTLQQFLSEELTRLIEQLSAEYDEQTKQRAFAQTPIIENSPWPSAIRDLAGAWTDLPMAEEIRKDLGEDLPREPF